MKIPASKIRKFMDQIEALKTDVETLRDGTQDKYDGKSDRWRDSDAGQKIEALISTLEDCANNLESAGDDLGNVELED
jgi:uncharacterized protein YukE